MAPRVSPWLALSCLAALLQGCVDTPGGSVCSGPVTLAVGQSSDQTLLAGACTAFQFTPLNNGAHEIAISAISTEDYLSLEFEAGRFVCAGSGAQLNCALLSKNSAGEFVNELTAGARYDFTLTEVPGTDTTYTVEVIFAAP